MAAEPGEVTLLIRKVRASEVNAERRLVDIIYGEIRRIAAARMRGERPNHTLTPTALANETWLRLRDIHEEMQDRQHFLAIAANAMRRALIDHARYRSAAKRNHGAIVSLEQVDIASPEGDEQLVALNAALERLSELNARAAKVVRTEISGDKLCFVDGKGMAN